jgi:adenylate cyclase class IV
MINNKKQKDIFFDSEGNQWFSRNKQSIRLKENNDEILRYFKSSSNPPQKNIRNWM